MRSDLYLMIVVMLVFSYNAFGQGLSVAWINIEHPLCFYSTNGCEAGDPLPDGTVIEIHQDLDNDGPDTNDPMPRVGDQPGNVNYDHFTINGIELGIGPGRFYTDPAWSSVNSLPPGSNSWYLVVRCSDSVVFHYTTENYFFTPNPTEVYTEEDWTCIDCISDAVSPGNPPVIRHYALHQNYPNPFNPETSIAFDLAESGPVILSVYNLIGQEVASLVNGMQDAGRHIVRFDAMNLSSGVYLYRITANNFTDQEKMLLLR